MRAENTETAWTIPISEALSVRLYANTRPHHQLIASLQKGLILVSNGKELAGEGIGLGVPALRYTGRTYFPGSSKVELKQARNHTTAIKTFTLNLTSERALRNVNLETEVIRKIRRRFDKLYRDYGHSRLLMIEDMLRKAGVRRNFVQVKPVGSATVKYNIDLSRIGIRVDFKPFHESNVEKIYILNEGSSQRFRKYYDSKGTVLFDNNIGAWETVNAEWACIYSTEDKVGFRLWKSEEATLHRGREFLNGILDWVGLDYEAVHGNLSFEYDIELVGANRKR